MSTYGTRFVETEALLAVMDGDDGEAYKILGEMLPGELAQLPRHARELADKCADVVRAQVRRAEEAVED